MAGPIGQCDAPGCASELVALIRGVGLCEEHLQRVGNAAAEQDTDPGSLSRAVIVALIQPEASSASSSERLNTPVVQPPKAVVRPGFYWVLLEGDWTVIKVLGAGRYLTMGSSEERSLEEHKFGRMLPVRQPYGFPWDPFVRR